MLTQIIHGRPVATAKRRRPAFARRHYREMAAAIAAVRALPHDRVEECWLDLIEELSGRFRRDNPEFRADRFRAACGVNGFDHAGERS